MAEAEFYIFFQNRGLWTRKMQIDGCNRGTGGMGKYILPSSTGADLSEHKIIAQ